MIVCEAAAGVLCCRNLLLALVGFFLTRLFSFELCDIYSMMCLYFVCHLFESKSSWNWILIFLLLLFFDSFGYQFYFRISKYSFNFFHLEFFSLYGFLSLIIHIHIVCVNSFSIVLLACFLSLFFESIFHNFQYLCLSAE